jgi:MFS family permease
MDRSMWAVLAGTFTLRFSTGLTGAMLAVYLAALPDHGGPRVDPITVGIFAATFYLAELVLSPIFGVLSDRVGHHRVMLFGPAFGAVAVIVTGLTTNLVLLGGTRWLRAHLPCMGCIWAQVMGLRVFDQYARTEWPQ